MEINGLILVVSLSIGLYASQLSAAPFADIKISSKRTHNGDYKYTLKITNQGPVLSDVATPENHRVRTIWGNEVDASGKALDQDDNIVIFGVNTGRDDLYIKRITNGKSAFNGIEELGWSGSQVIAWHLPFGEWPNGAVLEHGESIKVSFIANAQLKKMTVWLGGSDDDIIWIEGDEMAEDQFGIYNASEDGSYLSTFFERHINVKSKDKHKFESYKDID